ncbi:MAG TPA: glycosyltransferase, partial [Caldilineaceae bacterium]|nr:glycosyltransferase [Caldilineaceae bacterium]
MAPSPLRVTLDAGPAVHQRAGLSRYTEQLIRHLVQHEQNRVAVSLFYNAHSGHSLPVSLAMTPAATIHQGQLRWRLGALATQFLRWPYYERWLPAGELYHATEHLLPYLHRPAVLTVHDLIFVRYPLHHTLRNRLFLRFAMPRFVAAAAAVVAVSRQTAHDLVEFYHTPADKIHVIHEGIDPVFAPAPEAEVVRVRERYVRDAEGVTRPYLLMVGTLEPRKNHAAALQALARLKAAGHRYRLL